MKKHLTTPTIIRAKRVHGFLQRMSTPNGRKTIKRRRRKGRCRLVV